MPGAFGVSAAVGRVSNEDLGTTGTGGLTVGGPMASSTIRMGVTPDFTLESHLESGAASSAYGMGGSMAMGDWGALQLGTTQSQDTVMPTQRSGVGIQFKFDGQQFESSFESLRSGPQVSEQYLGFKHSWLLSQQTKIQVGGARELMSGTYSMNMELSIPFETLVSQWWRF
jgi:outer membrane usher protein FimD/PapC